MTHALVVRLDSLGDVFVCGPAVRAVAASADRVTMLVSHRGAAAAALLPGVDDVVVWDCPWITSPAPPVDRRDVDRLVDDLAGRGIDEALVLTSFHQSALPTALLLRLAGVARVAGIGIDFPGTLLDVRVPDPPDAPEPERMLAVATAAGYALPAGDDGRLRVVTDAAPPVGVPAGRFVAVHPGTDAPARSYPVGHWCETVRLLGAAGDRVVVTGAPGERALTATVAAAAPGHALDLGGATDVAGLAALLARADVLLTGNTGPAHLAAAVGTPVVSLFAPVVPARRWAPYGVPSAVLGDQHAACAGSRARTCPVEGHPCLAGVDPVDVVRAAHDLTADRTPEVVPA